MSGALGVAVIYMLTINATAYLVFAWDKHRSVHGLWRVSEQTLLLVSMMGGSPGAKLAQKRLRHKTRKQPFGRRLNTIIGVQALCGIALWVPAVRDAVQDILAAAGG
ncbi:DUF1294 domain-containing protein [Sulfitobacter sabulilitoris]|uniref:DUF1294 domain-containing protein n=1 Tax=Sulfitobacter sabulilitoris TaxID=2562655 RepID=A0A5S3PAP9_9RHOB|nr:DUF1294 domain-containing protein [Sulfitobacter sabulilitoris]TMM50594.1 DUF1294 domain-containing protein [Sulfitobacter sabulilitoris]